MKALGIVLFLCVAAASFAAGQREKDAMKPSDGGAMMSADTMKSDDKMSTDTMESDDKMSADSMKSGAMDSGSSMTGGRVPFSSIESASMLAAKSPTVLFFSAAWCQSCQQTLSEIDAARERLGGITVVVVDYDASAELRKSYGVEREHSFVRIDGMGKALAKWQGGGVSELLEHMSTSGTMM